MEEFTEEDNSEHAGLSDELGDFFDDTEQQNPVFDEFSSPLGNPYLRQRKRSSYETAVDINPDEYLRHFDRQQLRSMVEEQLAELMFGKQRNALYNFLSMNRVVPAFLSSLYNYWFSRAFNTDVVRFLGLPDYWITVLAVFTAGVNFAINTISIGNSVDQLTRDLVFNIDPEKRRFQRSGNIVTITTLGLALVGSASSVVMVYDAMSNNEDFAWLTIPMVISQVITNTGQNYRGFSGVLQNLFQDEYYGYIDLLPNWIDAAHVDYQTKYKMKLTDDILKHLYEGQLYRTHRFKTILQWVIAVSVLPYGLASYVSGSKIFTCTTSTTTPGAHGENSVVTLCLGGRFLFGFVSMIAKNLLLMRANWNVLEAIFPNNQILPARSRGTRNERIFYTCFAGFSAVMGSLTLGGAAQSVRLYLLQDMFSPESKASLMATSYAVAWVAAFSINAKDFNDLITVYMVNWFKWISYVRAKPEDKLSKLELHPLELMRLLLTVRPRSALGSWSIPRRPAYLTEQSTENTVAQAYLHNRGKFALPREEFIPENAEAIPLLEVVVDDEEQSGEKQPLLTSARQDYGPPLSSQRQSPANK